MLANRGNSALRHRATAGAPTWVLEIGFADVWAALSAGVADLRAMPARSLTLGCAHAVVGLLLVLSALQQGLAVLVVPLVIGLAILGPLVSVGFFELSRRREARLDKASWSASPTRQSSSLAGVVVVGLMLATLVFVWMAFAVLLAHVTLTPVPVGLVELPAVLLATTQGLVFLTVADGAAVVLAALAFAMSVVALPLLVDRDIDAVTAVLTSMRVVATNPWPMALWAVVVAAGFTIATITAFAAFVVVSPLLGYSTWHLYRRVMSD